MPRKPSMKKRYIRAEVTLRAGGKLAKVSDDLGWMVEMSQGERVNYVAAQLLLTVAAFHATTEDLTIAPLDLVHLSSDCCIAARRSR
jgi:hypothetical protein